MKINIEYIEWLQNERDKINNTPLAEIEFFKDGVKVDIAQETIEDFNFVGLSNIDFIETGYYKDENVFITYTRIRGKRE